ncbi:MAG: hypothetical protein NC098_03950 [Lachnoclostridium sp.]|nr:hypothetical protein [Lachnoclostridium sp.]
MKLKSLLSVAVLAATLHASAEYPIYFRDANNWDASSGTENPTFDAGGHMDFPYVEGTRGYIDGKINCGEPLWNEDGSITLTTNSGADGGVYFRTKKLTEYCPMEYRVFAYEYKSNRVVQNVVVFQHEYNNKYIDQYWGSFYEVNDDYDTIFIPITRNDEWGSEADYAKNYFWVSTNDENKREGWQITIKNLRMLTLEEATAQSASAPATGVIPQTLTCANTDITEDYDEDMENKIYVRTPGSANPVLKTSDFIKALPAGYTTFKLDYKLSGTPFDGNLFLLQNNALATGLNGALKFEACEGDPYTEDWKTIEVDLKNQIAEYNFAQTFLSCDYMWIQLNALPEDAVLWLKDARFENPDQAGIDAIVADQTKAQDNRVFNLMGIECKGNLTPGIYIQNGKKFVVK